MAHKCYRILGSKLNSFPLSSLKSKYFHDLWQAGVLATKINRNSAEFKVCCCIEWVTYLLTNTQYPVGNYLLKVNSRNTRTR